MPDPVIEINGLIKDFHADFWKKRVRILHGVDLTVERGDVFGFLGPNGSGKTTTLKILMGLLRPTSGVLKLFGQPHHLTELKKRIGFLPENPYFYEYLNTVEFLNFYAELFGMRGKEKARRIDALLELVGMAPYRELQLRKFSKGMLQRIGIAQALINDPELVILDEPQTGLDPIGRRDVREILLELKRQSKTVFFSSHIMHDVEAVCERIGIIIAGRIREVGPIEKLLNPRFLYFEVIYRGPKNLKIPDNHIEQRTIGADQVIKLPDEATLNPFVQAIYAGQGTIVSITPHKETLEELFVRQVKTSGPAQGANR